MNKQIEPQNKEAGRLIKKTIRDKRTKNTGRPINNVQKRRKKGSNKKGMKSDKQRENQTKDRS